ncbi:MAG: hypothetical protein KME04_03875 [Pleurocapsa minor GSE-CHR-MK-17-07R]|jgi:hypothetical protein|nr:hypothetical protein [Pleurocapsa minor GSE-CHR-MK 17-07R]
MDGLNSIHQIMFNAGIMYSFALGIWAAVMAARGRSVSGNFWGAVATFAVLAGITAVLGIIMALSGLTLPRLFTYFLYMGWLVVIMPGLFTILRGRDDRSAAIAFAILCFFNGATAISMVQRGLVGPWLPSA